MPAGREDAEAARRRLGVEGDIAGCIIDIGFSIENTTRAEVDAMYKNAMRRRNLGDPGAGDSGGDPGAGACNRPAVGAAPAVREDAEAARRRLGVEADLADCIISVGFTIENTTRAEVDAMYKRALRRNDMSGPGAGAGGVGGGPGAGTCSRSAAGAVPAVREDAEAARRRLGVEGDIAGCIIDIGFSIENTTRAEVDAMYKNAMHRRDLGDPSAGDSGGDPGERAGRRLRGPAVLRAAFHGARSRLRRAKGRRSG